MPPHLPDLQLCIETCGFQDTSFHPEKPGGGLSGGTTVTLTARTSEILQAGWCTASLTPFGLSESFEMLSSVVTNTLL